MEIDEVLDLPRPQAPEECPLGDFPAHERSVELLDGEINQMELEQQESKIG